MWTLQTPLKHKVVDVVVIALAILAGVAFSYGILARYFEH